MNNSKFCPITKSDCMETGCAWWSARSWQRIRDHAAPGVCGVLEIASNLGRIDAGCADIESDLDDLNTAMDCIIQNQEPDSE